MRQRTRASGPVKRQLSAVTGVRWFSKAALPICILRDQIDKSSAGVLLDNGSLVPAGING